MELRDIEYFLVVARHGHLGRAAEALELSQSALSKSLRRLEGELRAKLIKRTAKGIELTAEGSTLLARAHRLRLSVNDIAQEITDVSRGHAGHLRVCTGSGHAFELLPAACSALIEEAPNVTLNIRIAGRAHAKQALRTGEVDLLIQMMPTAPDHDLVAEYLHDEEYVAFVSARHRLAGKKLVTLADLAQERWALSEDTYVLWQHVHRAFDEHGLPPPRVTIQCGYPALRLPVIASSNLVGYSTKSMIRRALPHLKFAELRVKELKLASRIGVVYRKDGYLSPIARRFIEILKRTVMQIDAAARSADAGAAAVPQPARPGRTVSCVRPSNGR